MEYIKLGFIALVLLALLCPEVLYFLYAIIRAIHHLYSLLLAPFFDRRRLCRYFDKHLAGRTVIEIVPVHKWWSRKRVYAITYRNKTGRKKIIYACTGLLGRVELARKQS